MNSSSITVGPATPDDATGIGRVQHDTWLDTYPNEEHGITLDSIREHVETFEAPERIAWWREIIARQEKVMVAKDAGRVVGFASVKLGDAADELAAMYLLPEYHGKNVGQRLIEAVLTQIEPGREVTLEVATYNARAIRFYEKNGFLATGEMAESRGIPTMVMRRTA